MIKPKTKVIYFDMQSETYKVGCLKDLAAGQMVVCSAAHFIDTVCKFFEEVTPNMAKNPLWQDTEINRSDTGNSDPKKALKKAG